MTVQLRTPKRLNKRSSDVDSWKRRSAIKGKSVEIYSRDGSFSPTSVVIKTNPLFGSSATPRRLPVRFKVCGVIFNRLGWELHKQWCSYRRVDLVGSTSCSNPQCFDIMCIISCATYARAQGELQLNVHQKSHIAKTKEQEMVNAIIQLAKYGMARMISNIYTRVISPWHFTGEKKYERKPKQKSLFQKV